MLRRTDLRNDVTSLGGGTVFPVAKVGDRQRVVWHGSRVSAAATPPPKPRHLADPSIFKYIDLFQEGHRYISVGIRGKGCRYIRNKAYADEGCKEICNTF